MSVLENTIILKKIQSSFYVFDAQWIIGIAINYPGKTVVEMGLHTCREWFKDISPERSVSTSPQALSMVSSCREEMEENDGMDILHGSLSNFSDTHLSELLDALTEWNENDAMFFAPPDIRNFVDVNNIDITEVNGYERVSFHQLVMCEHHPLHNKYIRSLRRSESEDRENKRQMHNKSEVA